MHEQAGVNLEEVVHGFVQNVMDTVVFHLDNNLENLMIVDDWTVLVGSDSWIRSFHNGLLVLDMDIVVDNGQLDGFLLGNLDSLDGFPLNNLVGVHGSSLRNLDESLDDLDSLLARDRHIGVDNVDDPMGSLGVYHLVCLKIYELCRNYI